MPSSQSDGLGWVINGVLQWKIPPCPAQSGKSLFPTRNHFRAQPFPASQAPLLSPCLAYLAFQHILQLCKAGMSK